MSHFEQAIGLDPGYVLPYVAVANAFIILGVWGLVRPRDAFGRARVMAAKALDLDAELGEAHLAMALVHYLYDWEGANAGRHFRQAFEHRLQDAVAHGWYAAHLLFQGQREEALAQAERAVELEPLSPIAYTVSATAYIGAGQLDAAAERLQRALELDPDLPAALHWLGWCHAAQGRDREAATLLRRAAGFGLALSSGLLGLVLARMGEPDEARRILAGSEQGAPERYVPCVPRALAHAALGDEADFLRLLDEAQAEREPALAMLAATSEFLSGLLPPRQVAELRKRCVHEP
jgi:Tfp pilus assembly protein PilF